MIFKNRQCNVSTINIRYVVLTISSINSSGYHYLAYYYDNKLDICTFFVGTEKQFIDTKLIFYAV